jgi:hypothetical protein
MTSQVISLSAYPCMQLLQLNRCVRRNYRLVCHMVPAACLQVGLRKAHCCSSAASRSGTSRHKARGGQSSADLSAHGWDMQTTGRRSQIMTGASAIEARLKCYCGQIQSTKLELAASQLADVCSEWSEKDNQGLSTYSGTFGVVVQEKSVPLLPSSILLYRDAARPTHRRDSATEHSTAAFCLWNQRTPGQHCFWRGLPCNNICRRVPPHCALLPVLIPRSMCSECLIILLATM